MHTDARGAFELTGLLAGAYAVHATMSGRSSLPEVRVLGPGKTERLQAPLVVRPPQPLELRFDPPRDPHGEPWLLSVRTDVDAGNPPAQETPVGDGGWTHPGLALATYEVTVGDSRGNTWRRLAAVVSGATTLNVDLGSVPVSGQVSLGGQPLAARLVFASGGERLTLDTDAHGRYRGFLPDWNWRGSSSTWSLTLLAPRVARRLLAHLSWPPGGSAAPYSIDLPATTLRGIVTREAVAAEDDAWLVLPDEAPWGQFSEPPEPPLTMALEPPGPDGAPVEFLVRGLRPETLSLVAEGEHSLSQPVVCGFSATGEARAAPLLLRPVVRVRVRLLDARGLLHSPHVLATPMGGVPGTPRKRVAGDGALDLALPAGTTELAFAAAGRDRELLLLRVAVRDRARVALRVPEASARLRLSRDLAGRPGRLFLFKDGQAIELEDLRRLGVTHTPDADGEILVTVPAGRYALCALTGAAAERALLGRERPAGCAEGLAADSAELRLSLRPGP